MVCPFARRGPPASAEALPSDTFINTCNHLASIVPNLSLQ